MLSIYETTRIESMEEFGFGPNEMKKYKVCSHCYTITSTELDVCPVCSKGLPQFSLYELYAKKHYTCSKCKTVVPHNSKFCPQCGTTTNINCSDVINDKS